MLFLTVDLEEEDALREFVATLGDVPMEDLTPQKFIELSKYLKKEKGFQWNYDF